MGLRLSSWNLFPVDRYSKIKLKAGAQRSCILLGIKDKPHILTLEVKETSPTTHAQNGSLWVNNGGGTIP